MNAAIYVILQQQLFPFFRMLLSGLPCIALYQIGRHIFNILCNFCGCDFSVVRIPHVFIGLETAGSKFYEYGSLLVIMMWVLNCDIFGGLLNHMKFSIYTVIFYRSGACRSNKNDKISFIYGLYC